MESDVISKFLDCGSGVRWCERLMRRLEINVQIESSVIALIFLENAGDDSSGETCLLVSEVERLGRQAVGVGFFGGRIGGDCGFSAADHHQVRRNRDATV